MARSWSALTMRAMRPSNGNVCERPRSERSSLRIAMVTETYPPEVNGVARTVACFVAGLRSLGHEIQLIRPRQAVDASAAAPGNELLVHGLALPNYPGLRVGLPAASLLERAWLRRRPDVVHVVTEGPLGWSALNAADRLGIPLTSDFRTNFDSYSRHYGAAWLQKPIAAYLRRFHNRTLITMAPTTALRRQLLDLGYRDVRVVARGVDTAHFNPSRRSDALRHGWGAGAGDLVIGYVGRVAPEKNIPLLLDAFRAIRRVRAEARLVVVGNGPLGLDTARDDGVIAAGVRTGEELAAHYASFDCLLFPSLTETFGNVTLEAMSSGLAVVAYDYAAAAEHIEHEASGLLARYGDGAQFVEQAIRAATDSLLAARCRAGARRAAERLGWDRVVRIMEATLFAAANEPRRATLGNVNRLRPSGMRS